jgi:hypothetical protein
MPSVKAPASRIRKFVPEPREGRHLIRRVWMKLPEEGCSALRTFDWRGLELAASTIEIRFGKHTLKWSFDVRTPSIGCKLDEVGFRLDPNSLADESPAEILAKMKNVFARVEKHGVEPKLRKLAEGFPHPFFITPLFQFAHVFCHKLTPAIHAALERAVKHRKDFESVFREPSNVGCKNSAGLCEAEFSECVDCDCGMGGFGGGPGGGVVGDDHTIFGCIEAYRDEVQACARNRPRDLRGCADYWGRLYRALPAPRMPEVFDIEEMMRNPAAEDNDRSFIILNWMLCDSMAYGCEGYAEARFQRCLLRGP